ncbi:uncharacterized protein EV422DRAFT_312290 [Fimicolochytrium jonesii]|uniref:uncharacterized protein n=1 Tax=Fimicolochytrium jonesii TaxID=1396493 RepID=UPI0022FF04B8|nr:uncharacterized protein EV422DRAFT_312290 [Fimicolochytrium jonesii]KAI8824230.1 hypothetical protein EV422DRAFT_312290 [Fimicolochytrium jonesii]
MHRWVAIYAKRNTVVDRRLRGAGISIAPRPPLRRWRRGVGVNWRFGGEQLFPCSRDFYVCWEEGTTLSPHLRPLTRPRPLSHSFPLSVRVSPVRHLHQPLRILVRFFTVMDRVVVIVGIILYADIIMVTMVRFQVFFKVVVFFGRWLRCAFGTLEMFGVLTVLTGHFAAFLGSLSVIYG